MSRETQYQTFPNIDLSVAGRERHTGPFGYIKIIQVVDAAGALALDAEVSVRVGTFEADPVPLRIDGEVKGSPGAWDQFEISWEAQPGYKATVLAAYDPLALSISAEPASQLLLGSAQVDLAFPSQILKPENMYSATVAQAALASNYSHVQLKNPAGSGKVLYLFNASGRAPVAHGLVLARYDADLTTLSSFGYCRDIGGANSTAQVRTQAHTGFLITNGFDDQLVSGETMNFDIPASSPIVIDEGQGVVVVDYYVNAAISVTYLFAELDA